METSIGRTLASVMAAEELENKFLRTIKDPINEKGKWQTGCTKKLPSGILNSSGIKSRKADREKHCKKLTALDKGSFRIKNCLSNCGTQLDEGGNTPITIQSVHSNIILLSCQKLIIVIYSV